MLKSGQFIETKNDNQQLMKQYDHVFTTIKEIMKKSFTLFQDFKFKKMIVVLGKYDRTKKLITKNKHQAIMTIFKNKDHISLPFLKALFRRYEIFCQLKTTLESIITIIN